MNTDLVGPIVVVLLSVFGLIGLIAWFCGWLRLAGRFSTNVGG